MMGKIIGIDLGTRTKHETPGLIELRHNGVVLLRTCGITRIVKDRSHLRQLSEDASRNVDDPRCTAAARIRERGREARTELPETELNAQEDEPQKDEAQGHDYTHRETRGVDALLGFIGRHDFPGSSRIGRPV